MDRCSRRAAGRSELRTVALSLPVVSRVARSDHDSLDGPSAAAVARRLFELGALDEARTFLDDLGAITRQDAVEACATGMDVDLVRSELDREPAPATRRALLTRLAALGHVEEALTGTQRLIGAQHLHALALVTAVIRGERGLVGNDPLRSFSATMRLANPLVYHENGHTRLPRCSNNSRDRQRRVWRIHNDRAFHRPCRREAFQEASRRRASSEGEPGSAV
jgi:hypothetical protein